MAAQYCMGIIRVRIDCRAGVGEIMNSVTRSAKGWLVQSTRSRFYDVIREAKLSPRQMQIVELRFVDGLMNYQIAMQLNVSVKTVESDLRFIYRAVSRVLNLNRENEKTPA